MWLALMTAVLAQAPAAGDCVLEGTVTLTKDGARVSPEEAVVYVKDGPPRARSEPETHVVRQKDRQFHPRSLVVQLNDRVSFVNEDEGIRHSVFSRQGVDPFPGDVNARETTYSRTFSREGTVHIQCNLHEQMTTDVLVVRSPAFTRPDAKGRWRIAGLPRQAFTLVVWEPNGAEDSREVAACATGPVEFTLAKKARGKALRRDGSRYRPEYQDAMW